MFIHKGRCYKNNNGVLYLEGGGLESGIFLVLVL